MKWCVRRYWRTWSEAVSGSLSDFAAAELIRGNLPGP
jgi:hypothetical protein